MLSDTRVLTFLAQTARLGKGFDHVFTDTDRVWLIQEERAATGVLDEQLAHEVFETYAERHPEAHLNPDKVELLLGLRILRDDKGSAEPLLMLPCVLDRTGTLEALPEHQAWVALRRLKSDSFTSAAVTVTYLDAYRAHQELMEDLPEYAGWQEYFMRANDLFAAVVDADEPALIFEGVAIDFQNALLRIFEHDDTGVTSGETLSWMAEQREKGEPISAPVATLLSKADIAEGETEGGSAEDEKEDDQKSEPRSSKDFCGTLPEFFDMSEHDHETVCAITANTDDPLIIVNAPAGTSQLQVAVSAICDGIAAAAIAGTEPAHSLIVGTTEDLNLILARFSEPYRGPKSSLYARWLPRISTAGEKRRTLGPLPHLFGLFETDATAVDDSPAALRIQTYHMTPDASDGYATSWYVPQAATYFLDCVSAYLGVRVRDLSEARVRLADRLRVVDGLRRELFDAYANVCKADEHMHARDDLTQQISELRRQHTQKNSRLAHWEEVARRHPQRFIRFGGLKINQSRLIRKSSQEGDEPFTEGKTSCDQVVEAYRSDLERIETEIDRLRAASSQLSRRIKAAQPEGERCMQLISRLSALLKLDPDQQSLLESTIDGSHVSMEFLDKALDQTVRAAQFWISVHIFESRWMSAVRASLAKNTPITWKGFAALTPIILVEHACAPSVIKQWGFGRPNDEDCPRLDQITILSAERMDQCEGVALMNAAKRVVVFGSSYGLTGSALVGPTFAEISGSKFWRQDWHEARDAKIISCGMTSYFDLCKTCEAATNLALSEDAGQSSDLVAFRKRIDSELELNVYGRDDERERAANAIANVTVPLSYVLVPDSSWEQVGGSRTNEPQALSMMRWLERHGRELAATEATAAIITTTWAEARLIARKLQDLTIDELDLEVLSAAEAHGRRFDLVIFDTVSGPDAIKAEDPLALPRLMETVASCAREALLVFCATAWFRSTDPCAQAFFEDATCIGRLFSVARERATGTEGTYKPQALTRVLNRLAERGDIAYAPETSTVSHAVADAGLIERVRNENGRGGWKPTDAGLEIGIIETTDKKGGHFCLYSMESEAVVARIVNNLLDETEDEEEEAEYDEFEFEFEEDE